VQVGLTGGMLFQNHVGCFFEFLVCATWSNLQDFCFCPTYLHMYVGLI
jgi:hypothetical protein